MVYKIAAALICVSVLCGFTYSYKNNPQTGKPDMVVTGSTAADVSGLGSWTTPAFNAANFTASGSMTWTVDSADVTTYAYSTTNKTMTVMFYVVTSTVGGTPSTTLRIAVPAGAVVAKTALNPVALRDNGTFEIGYSTVAAGGTYISIGRASLANWTASTNTTAVYGEITFEIQ